MVAALALCTSSEWAAYESNPGPETLGALISTAEGGGLGQEIAPALYGLFQATRHWKVAQHLAQHCLRISSLTHAEYFAREALQLSGDDPFARVSVANVLWERRLPNAVLHETYILRVQTRRIRNRVTRRRIQGEIAELNVRALMYLANPQLARPWLTFLINRNYMTLATAITLAFGARHARAWELVYVAAHVLAPHETRIGSRVKALVKQGLTWGLCRALRARP